MTAASSRRGARTLFPAATGDRSWRQREGTLAARVDSLRAAVHEALGEPRSGRSTRGRAAPASVAQDWTATWTMVSALAEACVEWLRCCGDPDAPGARRLCELVLNLHELGVELCEHELESRARRLADCATGLRRLRDLSSSTDLFTQACQELVGRCGFGRAVLSRVEHHTWRPWTAFFSNDHEFQSWFAEWIDQPIPLAAQAPETLLLAGHGPALVQDTESAAVHRPIIIESGRSTSYVVAPVMRGNEVVGLLHADHFPSPKRVDDFDREVLWSFAAGFGHVFERLALMERLRAHRDLVRGVLSTTARSMDEICEARIDLLPDASAGAMARDAPVPGSPAPGPRVLGKLTVREAEVFELMIAGATNSVIAERLIITEETVKSHVKHILRKLGVANRSQAIAASLGTSGAGQAWRPAADSDRPRASERWDARQPR
ncbi:GAF domain-containing protein [Parafrankia irregularis]|uniref:GAF domain-containing protein n=1 Tax=Parafrankia irregularis TaxID=795642 RepID=A0A0S4QW90_9ACTN|nr:MULTISPECIES: LuxR C-terminal-related transcriptional regulator [Parafrankia]MBE3200361.1 GAF domain-containing protein [Parafrankia sp. CH37]CUU59789.1 GAF domain-containing protein [Parafrankia irregularis]